MEVCSGDYGYFHDKLVSAIDNGRCIYNSSETQLEEIDIGSNGKHLSPPEYDVLKSKDFDYESGWFRQFWILVTRMWLQMWRDRVRQIEETENYINWKIFWIRGSQPFRL